MTKQHEGAPSGRSNEQGIELTPAQKVLIGGAYLIEKMGWCQGSYVLNDEDEFCFIGAARSHKFCALGATATARRALALGSDAEFQADNVLGDYLARDVADWNDTKGRKAPQVIRAMREAAVGVKTAKQYWPGMYRNA